MKKWGFRFLEWLRSRFPDPVTDCLLYNEQGCSHVDGLLCDFPDCSMNNEYKKVPEVYVFNHPMFDKYCEDNEINDNNVEDHENEAFISIIGTPEIMEYYLQDSTGHWFQKEHPNVLNLEFDDVTTDNTFDYKTGYNGNGEIRLLHAFTMSEKQAEKCIDFIESNLGKNFRIHCKAGKSRSAAIARFLTTCYAEYMNAKENPDNPCVTYNPGVLATLKRVWYKKNKMFS